MINILITRSNLIIELEKALMKPNGLLFRFTFILFLVIKHKI